jgi:hypothetical protein
MASRNRTLAASLVAVLCLTLAGRADAHPGWHHGHRGGGSTGAAIAGAVIGAVVTGLFERPPPPEVQVYVPPPAYAQPVYGPPPGPVVVVGAPALEPTVGVTLAGLVDSSGSGGVMAGAAGALQFRTSSHSLLSLELQSLRADRTWDGMEREDLAGLLGLRLFLWDAWLTPYLDGAAGFGRASFRCCRVRDDAAQFLGRYGLGLELRLGRHLVFDGEVAQVHRLRLDQASGPVLPLDDHERATEVRGGVSFRF